MARLDLTNQVREPLIKEEQYEGGSFQHDPEKLASICHLDNHISDPKSDHPNRVISSGMIIEEFEGIEAIAQSLDSSLTSGISGEKADLERRRLVYGLNSFPPPKIKSLYELVMENFDDPINVILLGAAFVSVAIGLIKEGFPKGLIEGTSIMIALLIICVVNSGNNWISERRLANLVKLAEAQEVAVYRGSTDT